jgi:hypothetical protein
VADQIKVELKQRVHEVQGELKHRLQHIRMCPCTFVHGGSYNRGTGVLGKAYLVSRLQAVLQSGLLDAPPSEEMQATLDELRVYQVKISNEGKDTYGAITGAHDDLATALGLSVLEDPFAQSATYSRRVI